MNVCVVGYGSIGPVHAYSISQLDGVSLYGICDIDKERAEKGAAEYHCRPFYQLDDCLSDDAIDSIHICTPHYLHYEMIKKCVAAGKMVVVEKPIVMKKAELELLLEKYPECRIYPVLQNRTNQCIVAMKQIMDTDSGIGKLRAVKGIVTWTRDAAYYNSASWRGTKAFEGGGVLINQALHTLDLMIYLGGEIASVNATCSNHSLQGVIEVEDTVDTLLRYKNGAVGIFYATNAYGSNSSVQLELEFENASFQYINSKLYRNHELICEDDSSFLGKSYWGSGHTRQMYDIYCNGSSVSLADTIPTMRTLFSIYESAETGTDIVIS